jgi:hypothetical protein
MYRQSLRDEVYYQVESNIDIYSVMDSLDILPKTTLHEISIAITNEVIKVVEKRYIDMYTGICMY